MASIVERMRYRLALGAALIGFMGLGSQVASACGDKFLLVGRGVTFDGLTRYPSGVDLIVLPPKTVKSAAVRDSSLLAALKMVHASR